MNRLAISVPFSLLTGAFLGLLLGGFWLHTQMGQVNDGNLFILLTDFPGIRDARSEPWRTGYIIVLGAALVFAALGLIFTFTTRLTDYGKARFQTRSDMKSNGLLRPVGSGLVFAKLGRPESREPFISADFDKFPHCLVVAPTRAGKGVGFVIPNTLLFPGS